MYSGPILFGLKVVCNICNNQTSVALCRTVGWMQESMHAAAIKIAKLLYPAILKLFLHNNQRKLSLINL